MDGNASLVRHVGPGLSLSSPRRAPSPWVFREEEAEEVADAEIAQMRHFAAPFGLAAGSHCRDPSGPTS